MKQDPVTGDLLTPSEAIAWRVQWIIRRWTFLIALTALTAGAWTYVALVVGWGLGSGPVAVLTWWNVTASYLAVFIESVVGLTNFHQIQRDAVVLREVQANTKAIRDLAEVVYDELLKQEKD